ncbi:hypothetical protein DIPPA_10498 [Diplonema papillatum]|nr:hypothetical protein DIPPA_10498 [Diplonema papillatum]
MEGLNADQKHEWWRSDVPVDVPENPEELRERELNEKRPGLREVLRRVTAGEGTKVDITAQGSVPDDYMVTLCRAIARSDRVRQVYLGANKFGRRALEAVAGVMKCHPTVSRWSLAKCHLGRRGVKVLSDAVYCAPVLESLDLAFCTGFTTSGARMMHTAAIHNKGVTCLYLVSSDAPKDVVALVQSVTASRRISPNEEVQPPAK